MSEGRPTHPRKPRLLPALLKLNSSQGSAKGGTTTRPLPVLKYRFYKKKKKKKKTKKKKKRKEKKTDSSMAMSALLVC
jgi:hypothetical protein